MGRKELLLAFLSGCCHHHHHYNSSWCARKSKVNNFLLGEITWQIYHFILHKQITSSQLPSVPFTILPRKECSKPTDSNGRLCHLKGVCCDTFWICTGMECLPHQVSACFISNRCQPEAKVWEQGQAKQSQSLGYASSLQQFLAQGLPKPELGFSMLSLKCVFLPWIYLITFWVLIIPQGDWEFHGLSTHWQLICLLC